MLGRIVLSGFLGIFFAVCGMLIFSQMGMAHPVLLGIAAGGLFAWLLTGAMGALLRRLERRTGEAEQQLPSPPLWQTTCNFRYGRRVRNGTLYFCAEELVLLSLDGRPKLMLSTPRANITRISKDAPSEATVYTQEGTMSLSAIDAEAVQEFVRQKQWLNSR